MFPPSGCLHLRHRNEATNQQTNLKTRFNESTLVSILEFRSAGRRGLCGGWMGGAHLVIVDLFWESLPHVLDYLHMGLFTTDTQTSG